MTDKIKEMVSEGDWFGIARAITFAHVGTKSTHDGSTIDALNRAVRDAEINAGIDRQASSDSDSDTQGELDAAQSQGWR